MPVSYRACSSVANVAIFLVEPRRYHFTQILPLLLAIAFLLKWAYVLRAFNAVQWRHSVMYIYYLLPSLRVYRNENIVLLC